MTAPPQVGGPLVQYERAAYLSEGHLYLGITIKIKLGDGFAVFQNLYWCGGLERAVQVWMEISAGNSTVDH